MNNSWTQDEIDTLKTLTSEGHSLAECARSIGRSYTACRVKRKRLGLSEGPAKTKPTAAEKTLEQDLTERGDAYWRRQHNLLLVKYGKLVEAQSLVERLCADVRAMAPLSYSPAPQVLAKRKNSGCPQSAVLMLSDTHVGKVVKPSQTLGFGEYNFDVFLLRLKFLEDSVVSILTDHTTTPVPELIVTMLGDMIDGGLAHSVEAGQVNPRFNQFFGASHAFAQFFRNLAARVPKIRVKAVVGNHPRWDSQKKMPTENRFSNLDMFLYAMIQALTRDIENIHWDLNTQPFQIFGVEGFLFYAAHGDHLSGGDRALGIPNHAVGREVSMTTQLFNKAKKPAPDYYLLGHLHRSISLPHATGAVLVNGAFPGLDNYALASKFNPVDPSQRFFLVHPKYGKTASYDIGLKHAGTNPNMPPYQIPQTFEVI